MIFVFLAVGLFHLNFKPLHFVKVSTADFETYHFEGRRKFLNIKIFETCLKYRIQLNLKPQGPKQKVIFAMYPRELHVSQIKASLFSNN